MNIVPVLLVKNEEVWIRHIVTALANVFPHIIVSDTGSIDATIEEVSQIPQVSLFKFNDLSPHKLTGCRQFMQDEAKRSFGASHIFLVDGDELYPTKYLRYIADNPMPEDALSGFTTGIEVGELENGELWFYGHQGELVKFNRQTIIPVTSRWKGDYPFESPDSHIPGHPRNHYFLTPAGLHGFYHLHHTKRSQHDREVYLRDHKKNQFSMRDAPEIVPEKFWLKSRSDYRDE